MGSVLSKELAKLAGVSQTTVSRILTGRGSVSDEKRRAVHEAAGKLGVDIGTLRKSTRTIAFVMKRTGIPEQMSENPFYSRVLHGAEEEVAKGDGSLLYVTVDDEALERGDIPPVIKRHQADGLMLVGAFSRASMENLSAEGTPMVQLDGNDHPDVPCVLTDNACGARAMVKHLISRVGPDVRCLSYSNGTLSFREREAGYKGAFAELGLSAPEDAVFLWDGDPSTIDEAFRTRMPKAVFCTNDHLAVAVMRWAMEKGISIPSGLSVAGFDNVSIGMGMYPQLTTVHVDKEHMGALGVLTLQRMGKGYSVPKVSLVATELRIRGTTV